MLELYFMQDRCIFNGVAMFKVCVLARKDPGSVWYGALPGELGGGDQADRDRIDRCDRVYCPGEYDLVARQSV